MDVWIKVCAVVGVCSLVLNLVFGLRFWLSNRLTRFEQYSTCGCSDKWYCSRCSYVYASCGEILKFCPECGRKIIGYGREARVPGPSLKRVERGSR